MACLCSLQASNILNEVDRTKLFSNIPEIYAANRYFWTEYVLAMVNTSRTTGQPLEPGHLLQGFETFEQTFAPYTRYCAEQSKCQQYCRDRLNDNQLFTVYLVVRIFLKGKIKVSIPVKFLKTFSFFFFSSFFVSFFSGVRLRRIAIDWNCSTYWWNLCRGWRSILCSWRLFTRTRRTRSNEQNWLIW